MPCSKYYRSILPLDILQIVGSYAGDEKHKLRFTLSKKRRFLSSIRIQRRDPSLYSEFSNPEFTLRRTHWVPVRLNHVGEILTMLGTRCKRPENVLVPSLKRICTILLEVHDYTISRNMKNVW